MNANTTRPRKSESRGGVNKALGADSTTVGLRGVLVRTGSSRGLWVFFALTYAFSWLIWIPLALSGRKVALPVVAIGAISPSLAGVLMTFLTTDTEGRRDFWRRAFSFRLVRARWYAVIALTFPAIMAMTIVLETLLSGAPPSLDGAVDTLARPVALLSFIVTMLIGGPLAEELGWRGYALDKLQSRWSALTSSLLLGFVHVAWHLPLFSIQGTSQGEIGLGTPLFWLFTVQVVATSVLYTWVYNHNGRSILSAILIHFVSNSTFTIVAQLGKALPVRTEIIRTLVTVLVAVVVVIVWGPRTLTKQVAAPGPRAVGTRSEKTPER